MSKSTTGNGNYTRLGTASERHCLAHGHKKDKVRDQRVLWEMEIKLDAGQPAGQGSGRSSSSDGEKGASK